MNRWSDRYERDQVFKRYGYAPSTFRERLLKTQNDNCAWCHLPLANRPHATHVDHNHRCCSGTASCGNCIRGAVHDYCNQGAIRHADWAYENGCLLPPEMEEYITRGERFTSLHELSELDLPIVQSAEDEYFAGRW